MKMTEAQKRALDAVQDMIKVKTDDVFAHNIMILIFGILNVEHDIVKDTIIPLNPSNGNDEIQINIPDWVKPTPIPPFVPGDYQPPQVWYNHEPEPIQTDARKDVRYVTEVTCTGDKNGIVHTTNTNDVQYNGGYEEPKIN